MSYSLSHLYANIWPSSVSRVILIYLGNLEFLISWKKTRNKIGGQIKCFHQINAFLIFMMLRWMNKKKDAARIKLFASWITVQRPNLKTGFTDVVSTLKS